MAGARCKGGSEASAGIRGPGSRGSTPAVTAISSRRGTHQHSHQGGSMSYSLSQLIEERQADQYDLHTRYISPHMARVQQILGFDQIYPRGGGGYLWGGG